MSIVNLQLNLQNTYTSTMSRLIENSGPVVWYNSLYEGSLVDRTEKASSFDQDLTDASANISNASRILNSLNNKQTSFLVKNNEGQAKYINLSIERTVGIIVDEHLAKLNAHQTQIKLARKQLKNSTSTTHDENYITTSCFLKLKLRDEQTKSIATIKQLKNDVKELNILEEQCRTLGIATGKESLNRLSKVRKQLIDATASFMNSNKDIKEPCQTGEQICDDLKMESNRQINPNYSQGSNRNFFRDNTNLENLLVDEDSCDKIESQTSEKKIEFSLQEIQMIKKLERDTIELRRLFQEFAEITQNQGVMTDMIQHNIITANHHINEGHHHLNKSMKSISVLVPVTGCLTGALIGGPLGLILGGKTMALTIGCLSTLLGLAATFNPKSNSNESASLKSE